MNKYQYIFSLILLNMLILLPGCQSKQQRYDYAKEEIQIGVVVYDEYDTFIGQLMDCFMEEVSREVKNGKRITVKRYNASGSQIQQNEQVEEMIERGCNVLCVNLVDRTDPSMIIEAARKANVPVIFFNRELVEKDLFSWKDLYYVGADAFDSGKLQGEYAARLWQTNPEIDKNNDGVLQYIVLEGEAGHQDAIVRSEYSVNALISAGISVEKLSSSIANWNRAQAQSKMAQLLNKYESQIEVVFCNNDDMALGALDEYKHRAIPKEDRPVILGIDGTDVGLDAVENGELACTIYNDKEGQASSMLQLAIAAVTDEGLEDLSHFDGKYIRYPYVLVTNETVDTFRMTKKKQEAGE